MLNSKEENAKRMSLKLSVKDLISKNHVHEKAKK